MNSSLSEVLFEKKMLQEKFGDLQKVVILFLKTNTIKV